MHVICSLSAAFLLVIAGNAAAQEDFVEHKDVAVTAYNSAIVTTALSDQRNYSPNVWAWICVSDVYRVREAVANNTREIYFEVNGCAVKKPQIKSCRASSRCTISPFEVRVTGPETTPQFDPVATLKKGKAVQTPYKVESIGRL